jgi:hypothetical protein
MFFIRMSGSPPPRAWARLMVLAAFVVSITAVSRSAADAKNIEWIVKCFCKSFFYAFLLRQLVSSWSLTAIEGRQRSGAFDTVWPSATKMVEHLCRRTKRQQDSLTQPRDFLVW